MKIGYYVQGSMDEAFVWGLKKRWCPDAELAPGKFRGSSHESFRREIRKALIDLRDSKRCDVLVVLTDADVNRWRDVKQREFARVPENCRDLTVFGVSDRNIECWLALDRGAMARELKCQVGEIPGDDPSGFVKRRLGMGERDANREQAKERVEQFVSESQLKWWIEHSDSFQDFYDQIWSLSKRVKCDMPNEREN